MTKYKILTMLFFLIIPLSSFAAIDKTLVKNAETYLNSITGLSGEFMQIVGKKNDGGDFSMLRPGRVRLDYDTMPVQLISNGDDLFFYDKSLDQITTVPLTATPAGILVRKKINLTGADIVVSETSSTNDTFSLDMHIKGQEGMGHMRVDFLKDPIKLKSWVVYDATGVETNVNFTRLKTKTDFPRGYFQLQKMKSTSNSGGDKFYE